VPEIGGKREEEELRREGRTISEGESVSSRWYRAGGDSRGEVVPQLDRNSANDAKT